jgi:salicylate hydroxylase
MTGRLEVLVAGAGIGGLAAALALQRAGHRVRVFERTAELAEVGAGLTITPNASHVLRALDLWPALQGDAVIPATAAICNGVTGETLNVREYGQRLRDECGAEYFHVHRADLHGALLDALQSGDAEAISLADAFVGIERNDASGVHARFERSGEVRGDLLIGADGLRSAVRVALFGAEQPAFTGYVAYRGLVPTGNLPARWLEHAACMSLGPRNMFLRYLVSGGRLLNVACIGRSDQWAEEGWSVPASHAELLALLEGWHEDIRGIVAAIPAERLFKWGLFARSALPRWSVERSTLVGDAAHPLLPFLGQGAVMAIEDAGVLQRAVAAYPGDVTAALACYQRTRIGRANGIMALSMENGQRLVPRSAAEYQPGSHTSPASLGLMHYDPMSVPLA